MTTLDLNGYDALTRRTRVRGKPVSVRLADLSICVLDVVLGEVVLVIALKHFGVLDDTAAAWVDSRENMAMVIVGAILVMVVLVLRRSVLDYYDYYMNGDSENGGSQHSPSFRDFVNEAYGVGFSGLPDDRPGDGSIRVTWNADGRVHSGIADIKGSELRVKEAGGDYLEVEQ